jgi:ribosomal protein L11 methylase PrmA
VTTPSPEPSSFRDPSGLVFRAEDGTLLRQVNRCYAEDYRLLMDGGLYQELTAAGLMVEHEDVPLARAMDDDAYRVIRPREVAFVSYPYEWAFGALKEAALLTLDIQRRALAAGMTLKDASGYNVQFEGTRPVFIDTLSFERYRPGRPWTAYSQFCRHFLAPLALMAGRDAGLGRLLGLHLDGIPLELAAKLLPWTARLRPGILVHVCLQARMVRRYGKKKGTGPICRNGPKAAAHKLDLSPSSGSNLPERPEACCAQIGRIPFFRRVSPAGLVALVENLRRAIAGLSWRPGGSHWTGYYRETTYSAEAFDRKRRLVEAFLRRIRPRTVWDLGANTGVFSRLAADMGAETCALDADPACVEILFRDCRAQGKQNILPLCMDLANPSPSLGWAHRERRSLADRGPADVVMALALIHHLAISNNLPLPQIAGFFRRLGRWLIVEFVPKTDPQVSRLLRSRQDVFRDYDRPSFERAFASRFAIVECQPLEEEGRVLYLMQSDEPAVNGGQTTAAAGKPGELG